MGFIVEYGRYKSKCKTCESQINKGVLRIGEYQQAVTFDGKIKVWYHVDCFSKILKGTNKKLSIADFENVQLISFEDQNTLLTALDTESPLFSNQAYQEQCLKFDEISKQLAMAGIKTDELERILKENGQYKSRGIYEQRQTVADMLISGALNTCKRCSGGVFRFQNTGYVCQTNSCRNQEAYPERLPYQIPQDIKEKYPFLGNINNGLSNRILLQQPKKDTQSFEQDTYDIMHLLDTFKQMFKPKTNGVVYVRGDEKFSVLLIRTDVGTGKNAFYKLQILVTKEQSFIVFRAWGRIGTLRGDRKEMETNNIEVAINMFQELFFKRTENEWHQRNNFVKKLLRYSPLQDVEEDFDEFEKLPIQLPDSKLPVPVQNLLKLLFDEARMKAIMQEDMNIDVKKFPLGKLGGDQFTKATATLFELQHILNQPTTSITTINDVIGATNRFYELIPHNFGDSVPEMLDTKEKVADKLNMLVELRFICFTFDLRKNMQTMNERHDIDILYEQLNVSLDVLPVDSVECMKVQKYVDETSSNEWMCENPEFVKDKDLLIGMRVKNIFKITRPTDQVADPTNDAQKLLLWHGSPLLNYVNILRNGLKIAPFGIKRIGRDLGDGIYLADMFSYSAYYCRPRQGSINDSTIYMLLLCEATVGTIEQFHDRNEALPVGVACNSVMGVGKYYPSSHDFLNQIKFPCGKIEKRATNTYFTCNEYVVYREDQVKLKYLVQVERNIMDC